MEVKRITIGELKAKLGSPEIFIVDVRNPKDWADSTQKIPGALRIPMSEIETRYQELPKDKQLVFYCT